MKALICAAGEGKRLRPYTKDYPKALLKLGDKTLIELMLNNLSECGINEAIVTVGYKKESISNTVGNKYKKCIINYVENKDYENTNNMYSLWLAMKMVDDDVIFFNADIVFDIDILKDVIESEHANAVAISEKIKQDSMMVVIENGFVKQFGKFLSEDVAGDSIGIYKLSQDACKRYSEIASRLINQGHRNASFVNPLNELIDQFRIKAIYTRNRKHAEIDTLEDYEYAQRLFS